MARYQQKEEGQNQKKNVMKHELKVPKAGQLDAVKASRLRQLSSNQLKGFRIRTQNNVVNSNELDDNPALYQTYGLESNAGRPIDKKGHMKVSN